MKNGVPVAVSSMERGPAEQRGMWGRDNFFFAFRKKRMPYRTRDKLELILLPCLSCSSMWIWPCIFPSTCWLLPCPSGSPQHPELPVLMGTRSAPANPGGSIRCLSLSCCLVSSKMWQWAQKWGDATVPIIPVSPTRKFLPSTGPTQPKALVPAAVRSLWITSLC